MNPKKLVNVKFESKKASLVSFLAIDKKLIFKQTGHDITKEDVTAALLNTKKLAYKQNEAKDVTFDTANNNFVVNLRLDEFKTCTNEENELLSKMDGPTQVVRSTHGARYYRGKDTTPIPIKSSSQPKKEAIDVREDFPETWIWQKIELAEESSMIEVKVPDSMTTWVFTGFAVNKKHGFALAEPQELIVSKDFFVEVNLPYSIKFGEILKLEILAFNFVPLHFAGELDINIKVVSEYDNKQHFEFIKFKDPTVSCEAEIIPGVNQTESLKISHRSGKRVKFHIKPLINKEIKIRIEAEARRGNKIWTDKVVKSLRVENQGVAYFSTKNYEFRLNNENQTRNHKFEAKNVKEGSIDLTAVITGDMMGVSLKFYEGLL